jgi:hypothetical protein
MARGLPGPRRRRLRLPEGDPAGLTIFAAYGSASTDAKALIGVSGRLGQSVGSVRSVRGHQARCQRARPRISADLAL